MNRLHFKCLVLDHDNTVAATTPHIQYPAFMAGLKAAGITVALSESQFIRYEYRGLRQYVKDELHLDSKAALLLEKGFYKYADAHQSQFYDGITDIVRKHTDRGGIICVVSKSPEKYIRRDYREYGLPPPSLIFGDELEQNLHKPNPYALTTIMSAFRLAPNDLLLVDDKQAGLDMAYSCAVKAAVAGWGLVDETIRKDVKENCGTALFFDTVSSFDRYLFGTE